MFRIAYCDDEKNCRDQLLGYLSRYAKETGEEFEILGFDNADRLLLNYPKDLDLLFLDIAMGGIDGMEAAHEIRRYDPTVCIIFITTMFQYALDGYAVRAFGFVKKPVLYDEFSHEITCALRQIESMRSHEKYYTVKFNDTIQRLPVSKISYCEVQNHSAYLHLDDAVVECRSQMNTLEEDLNPYGFFRCHASFLVNTNWIKRIEAMELELKTGERIPISQRKKKDFLAALSLYVGDRI